MLRWLPQVAAPLVPRLKGPADTAQFQEYEENNAIFRIQTKEVYAKDFEEF